MSVQAIERAGNRSEPVTAWRLKTRQIGRELAQLIIKNAEAEVALAIGRETAEDISFEIRSHLLREYGRTFDPRIDGPPPGTIRDPDKRVSDKILEIVSVHPGLMAREIAARLYGRDNNTVRQSVGLKLTEFCNSGVLRRDGLGTHGEPFRYFKNEGQ